MLYDRKKGTVEGFLYLQKQTAYQGGVTPGQVLGGAKDAAVDSPYNLRLTGQFLPGRAITQDANDVAYLFLPLPGICPT